jgi:hypothetical protein
MKNDAGLCECNEHYLGDNCEFNEESMKYACSPACKHGALSDDRTSCVCDAGFSGFDCSRVDCGKHGEWGCSGDFCAGDDMKCLCKDGFEGPTCSEVCQEAVCTKGQGSWNKSTCSCDCLAPWEGPLCEACAPKDCLNGLVLDPLTCGCICPAENKKVINISQFKPSGSLS